MKNNKAITLIALVITIIVIMVLAAVSINMVMDDDGIIRKAIKAKENTILAEQEEKNILNEAYSALMIATNDSAQITITVKDLKTLISDEVKAQLATTPSVPAGTVISYITGTNAPSGYLKCDGTVYNISDYQTLADTIKSGLGSYNYYGGDGVTTFAVPDLRGEFLRGTGTNSHANQGSGYSVGKHQDATNISWWGYDTNKSQMTYRIDVGDVSNDGVEAYFRNSDGTVPVKESPAKVVTTEANIIGNSGMASIRFNVRPTNTSVLYCIKY